MVYKRFIKKGGKVYGPYYYSSKKENGKVISQYHGKTESSVKNSYKKFFLLGFFVFFLTASFFFVNYGLTGKASLDIESKYVEGEKIKGNLKFSLKQGELIPVDSKVVIHLGDEAQEYFLSELVDLNFTSGNFHAEGVTIPGEGIGYGLIGKKKIYPEVSFDLRIFEKEVEEASEQETDEEEISEEVDENEVNETEEEDEVESEEESAEEEGEEVESSLITGEVIAESYEIVSGTVGRENNFVYEYEKGKMVELVPGSVSVDGIIIDDGAVNVKSENKKVIVSTSYYHEEEGFGEEYLKNNELKLDMGFEQFDLVVQNDSELVVLLVYEGIILAEASEVLSVVSEVVEEPEVGEEPEEIEEGPEVVMDETIIFVVENFTAEFNISTIQYGAVLNKNVKWKKSIKTTDAIDLRVQIPKNAENIAVYKLNEVLEEVEESNESLDEPAVGENLIKIINETASEKNVTGVVNETSNESIGNETTEISSTSEDDETNVIVVNQTNVSIGNKVVLEEKVEEEIEKEKQNSKITAEVISGEILAEIDLAESSSFFSFFGKIFKSLTGRSIVVEETEEVKEIIINENATEFEIEYETPGPVAIEENTGFGKSVIVSSKVHYENILAYSELPRSVPESKVKLYHIVNGSRVEVDFVGYSVDETAINDTLVSELTKEKNQTDVHQANKSSAVFGITGNVVEKSLNEEIIPSLPLTEIIETTSQNDSDQSLDETSVSAISETESSASNADGSVTIISGNATVDGIVSDEIPVIVEAKINKTNTEKLLNKTPKKMISYIEWVVPHLSDQTYEIVIEISNAEHLDENRIFIENIYGEVKAKDDVWSDEIKDRRYVRVTFEKNLTVENDITVYARDAGLFGSSNIEIYLEGRDEIITTIENIGDEGWYKTYLTNMTEEGYGTFDLRIDGGIEFDFIVDPQRFDTACANFTGTYYHTGCNDGNITLSIDNSTTNYYSQGNYTSNAFDAGMTVSWDNVSWSAIIPSLGKNYFGDGSDGAVTISSNTELNIINNGGDYDGDMVVRNYNSLVIADGITLTTNDSGRGLLIYVEGNVVINGTLSMTARGAKANPANDNDGDGTTVGANGVRIGMFKSGETDTLASAEFNGTGTAARAAVANQPAISENGKVFTIARAGANGGAGGVPVNSGSSGSNGGAGQSGGGGGGGSDAARNSGGDGTAGTVFSGGTGGGGTGSSAGDGEDGATNGGKGGDAQQNQAGTSSGAGNPGGEPASGGGAGESGTGGLLILIVGGDLTLGPSGVIVSNGSDGGDGPYGGGGATGGGNILVLYGGSLSNSGTIQAKGGQGGSATGGTGPGGDGGDGSVQGPTKIDSIPTINISLKTRTSNDNSTWTSWNTTHANPSGIFNTSARYVQYVAELDSTNLVYTPFLEWVNLSYTMTYPTSSKFAISNSSGSTVASIDNVGNMFLRGTKLENQGVAMVATPNSFVVKNSSGSVLSYINETGSLFLNGTVTTGSVAGLTKANLEIKNSSGGLVAFFDNKGHLKLKGSLSVGYPNP